MAYTYPNKIERKTKLREMEKIKSEIKIGIVHEGFEKRYNNDFRIKNKKMIATTKNAKYFKKLVDMTIGTTYKERAIEKIIINADGAGWCKDIAESPKERYQRKRMKKNRTSWSTRGSEAMVKVISYIKSNLLEDLINGTMEKVIQKELAEREPEPRKVRKIKQGKIKYATKNSILESLTGFRKQKVKDLLKAKSFN